MKFSKLFASAMAVSMLASVAAVSANALGEDPVSQPYSLSFAKDGSNAFVYDATAAEGIKEVTIPDVYTEDGKDYSVVGVAPFAFDELDLDVINVPDSLTLDEVNPVSFLTKADINKYLETVLALTDADIDAAFADIADLDPDSEEFDTAAKELAMNASANKIMQFAANTVEFKGKKDWKGNEDELLPAAAVLANVHNALCAEAGIEEFDNVADFIVALYTENDLTKIVRTEDEDTLKKMSAKSYANFIKWVETIPFDNLTLKGSDGIPMQDYAKTNEIRGLKYEVVESCILGDANHDGVFNIRDAAYVAKKLANQQGNELHLPCADFNKDGVANIRDAAAMARELAKLK
jgi:hypothetical protein